MSFADRANQGPPTGSQGMPCAVAVLLGKLEPKERAGLEKMLGDRAWPHTVVMNAIVDEGHTVPRATLERHRRLECRCAKKP